MQKRFSHLDELNCLLLSPALGNVQAFPLLVNRSHQGTRVFTIDRTKADGYSPQRLPYEEYWV
jgi:hypothetical protein